MVKKYVNYGASVRATQFLVMAAKARALIEGRYHVTIEDLQSLAAARDASSRLGEFPRGIGRDYDR